MRETSYKKLFWIMAFNCFCIGFMIGVGLFSYLVTENFELVPISQETNQSPEYWELKAENCTATGTQIITPWNEDFYKCEVFE